MSILLDDQKWINIRFRYIETITKNNISKYKFIKTTEELNQYINNPNLKELNTGWKVLTWSDYNSLYYECSKKNVSKNGVKTNDVDFIKLREMKLKSCLKSWDLKDDFGNDVPLNDKTIESIHPDVANELLNSFEKITNINPGELKNLELSAEAFLEGKQSISPPPKIVYEFLIARATGWSLEYIRNLTVVDFYKILKLCTVYEGSDRKWEADLATVGMKKRVAF